MKYRVFALTALLLVSIGFGFVKQVKTALLSWNEIGAPAQDAAARYVLFKQTLESLHAPTELETLKIGYRSNRPDSPRPGQRPREEYRYDIQYALAPLLVWAETNGAHYLILDYENEATLESYIQKHSLQVLARVNQTALVRAPSNS